MRAVFGIMGFLLIATVALLFSSSALDWIVPHFYHQDRTAKVALFTTFGDASLEAMRQEIALLGKAGNLVLADELDDATDIAVVVESWEQLNASNLVFGEMAYETAKAADLVKFNSVTLSLKSTSDQKARSVMIYIAAQPKDVVSVSKCAVEDFADRIKNSRWSAAILDYSDCK